MPKAIVVVAHVPCGPFLEDCCDWLALPQSDLAIQRLLQNMLGVQERLMEEHIQLFGKREDKNGNNDKCSAWVISMSRSMIGAPRSYKGLRYMARALLDKVASTAEPVGWYDRTTAPDNIPDIISNLRQYTANSTFKKQNLFLS